MNQEVIAEEIQAIGLVHVEVFGEDGRLKTVAEFPNLVVTAGKNVIADRLGKSSPTKAVMSHMSLGTSSTTPAAADTTLGAEIAGSRTVLTSTTVTGNQVQYVATFGAGVGTGAVVEAGIFNAASAGDMLCRTTFSVINKGASDTMTVSWTVTVS